MNDASWLMTNEHCINSKQKALNTDYEFMYETSGGKDCNSAGVHDYVVGHSIYDADENYDVYFDANNDWAFVKLKGDPAKVHG